MKPALVLFGFCILVMAAKPPVSLTKSSIFSNFPATMDSLPVIKEDSFFTKLFAGNTQLFDSVIAHKDEFRVQIIYTQIDRTKKGKPKFTDHFFNYDPENYFYPASTIKFAIAVLALQKLNELKVPGLDKYSTMVTGSAANEQTTVVNDPSAADGRPTIAHYIKKILLVSDNDASNRLYEFLGQEYINNTLYKMGYTHAQIIHRLQISLTEEENRRTNPISFYDTSGKLLYEKPAMSSSLVYAERNTRMGKGFYRGEQLINEPFDFSKKNRLTLFELHQLMRSVLFPNAVPESQRFNLTKEDYAFLYKYMSMTPPESRSPEYDPSEYWDTYVKFLLYGREKSKFDTSIRIFNKVGDAYGFLIDAAYVVDHTNKIEFMLSATIHCNSDGIFNDDKYDYENVGFPFMKKLGEIILEQERQRKRKYSPDHSSLLFNYNE